MNISQTNNITIIEIPKKDIEKIDFVQCSQPTQTLEEFKASQTCKPDLIINGGFFDLSSGNSVMDFIDNQQVIADDPQWNSLGIGIDLHDNLTIGVQSDMWKDFITAYPILLNNGVFYYTPIASELNYKARRSIIGYNETSVFFIVIDNPGANFREAADIARRAGCIYAINLDGGGSTRMICGDQVYAAASYNRPVDNVIAVYCKQAESIIYRVQLGAFSNKTNAQVFCNKVKAAGGFASFAFVIYKEPYYKVQVGAFKVKQNAEIAVKELREKGFNAFITVG